MKPNKLINTISLPVGPANPYEHLTAVAQFVSNTYANGQYVEEISQQYFLNCHYDWDTTRLIWDGERLVHHWGVWGYPMRLGGVSLKVLALARL